MRLPAPPPPFRRPSSMSRLPFLPPPPLPPPPPSSSSDRSFAHHLPFPPSLPPLLPKSFSLSLSLSLDLPPKPTSDRCSTFRRFFSHGDAPPCSHDPAPPSSGLHIPEEVGRDADIDAAAANTTAETVPRQAETLCEDCREPLAPSPDTASLPSNVVSKKSGTVKCSGDKRRGLFGRQSQGRIPDLLRVPGIGPRNMEKFLAKGIGKVSELKQLYVDKFRGNGNDKMIEYLQSSVGILHKHHAMSITTYIKDSVEKELGSEEKSSSDASSKKRLTFCIEGNISVGKTTFLHRVTNEAIELRDLVEIVPEPIAKWQDVGPQHFNILDAFYAEPQRYAYTFQNYVFITRLMQEQESAGSMKPLRLMERSVFTDRMVFVRAVHEAKWMNEMEISIYDSWFNPVVSALPGLVPDGFIYLRASPDTCHRRLQTRKRPEERGVTIDYLRDLHEKHEQWLFPASSSKGANFSVSQPSQFIEPLPATLRDRVFYLEGENVHSSLQKVPALILDCDQNIDFVRDVDAKAAYAKQVSEFFEYVKRTKGLDEKEVSSPDAHSPSFFLPSTNRLFMPDGSVVRPGAVKPQELRQQTSVLPK